MEQPTPEIERDEERGVLIVRHYGRVAELSLADYDRANPYMRRVLVRNAVLANDEGAG